jgi:hypothetical protein
LKQVPLQELPQAAIALINRLIRLSPAFSDSNLLSLNIKIKRSQPAAAPTGA